MNTGELYHACRISEDGTSIELLIPNPPDFKAHRVDRINLGEALKFERELRDCIERYEFVKRCVKCFIEATHETLSSPSSLPAFFCLKHAEEWNEALKKSGWFAVANLIGSVKPLTRDEWAVRDNEYFNAVQNPEIIASSRRVEVTLPD